MSEAVARKSAEREFDCLIADSVSAIEYALGVGQFPKIVFHHNVDSVLAKRRRMLEPSRIRRCRLWCTWRKAEAYERRMSKLADAHIVVSDVDKAELLALVPEIERIEVVGNGVDMDSFSIEGVKREENSIIFTGLPKYAANMDGLGYFHREVFPIVRQKWNDVILRVTGDFSDQKVDNLQTEDSIIFTGYLNDVKHAVASSWISIAPIRVGSGTRLKILEAMALGTPVVATSVGAEGLDVEHERDILIADDPQGFARQVLRLHNDHDLWKRLSRNGKRLVEKEYDWKVLGKKFDNFLHVVCAEFSQAGGNRSPTETVYR
jgi:glycosyltransferase involved in cell wall biosynthesis